MTVKELIKQLLDYPIDQEVKIATTDLGYQDIEAVDDDLSEGCTLLWSDA